MNVSSILRLRNCRVRRIACAVLMGIATCVCSLPGFAQTPFPQTQNQLALEPAVDFQTQAVTFYVPIVGTPFRFNYRSDAIGPKWRWSVHHRYVAAMEILSPGDGPPRHATAVFRGSQGSSWFSGTEMAVAASDGSELYIFNNTGQHLRTLDALTGAVLRRFDYSPTGVLTAIEDGYGNKTAIERDSTGFMSAAVAPHGQRTTFSNDPSGNTTKITNPAGETVSLKYGNGQLNTVTDPRGNTYQFALDSSGHATKFEDPAGGIVSFSRESGAKGFKVSWDTATTRGSSFAVERTPNGEAIAVASRADGAQTQIQTRSDGTTKLVLPDGTALTRVGQADPWLGSQNSLLKTLAASTPDGLTPVISLSRSLQPVNANGPANVTSLTDTITINGRRYTRSFDAKTRQIVLQTPAGRKAVSTLNEHGQIAHFEVPGLAPIGLSYDSEGRWTGLAAGTGTDARVISGTYNSSGWIASVIDPLKRSVRFEYDSAGRINKRTLPDGSSLSFKHDAAGNVIAVTPPGRPAHVFALTSANLISAYSPPGPGDVASDTANGFFHSIGALFVRLWSGIRTYVLEVLHIRSTAQPEQNAVGTSYMYNNDGQLTKITRPDRTVIDAGYDSSGRLTRLAAPGTELRLDYDPKTKKVASITTSDGTVTYGYDGLLLTRAAWSGTIKGVVSFIYDNNLRPSSSSVNGAAPVTLEYDADGLLTRAGKLTLKPDPASGFLVGTSLANVTTAQDYNSFGEITVLRAAFRDRPLFAAEYGRDALGRIIRKTETVNGQTVVYTYAYDDAGRLADVTANGASTAHYAYDTNGNRITVTRPKGTINAGYDVQDRLTRYGNIVFKSTSNGDRSSKSVDGNVTTYSYDAFGNLKAVSLPNGTRIEYLVDGQNRRIGKKVNGNLAQGFLYQDQLRPAAELDAQGNVVSRFIYGTKISVPEYLDKGGNIYRIITDHLGSPRLVVDSSTGEIAQRLDYDEFGNVVNDTKPGFQPFGFAGGIYDPDTQLTRFNARDYDAETGQWTAKDPLLFQGGDTDLFAYLRNDPLNAVDPTGLAPTGVTTVGVSGTGWSVHGGGTVGAGVVVGSQGDVGIYVSGGLGVGKGNGFSAGTSVAVYPNATRATDIGGPFVNVSGGGGGGLGGSGDFAYDPLHPSNYGIGATGGAGGGYGGFVGGTDTKVWPLPVSIPTSPGDWLGDAFGDFARCAFSGMFGSNTKFGSDSGCDNDFHEFINGVRCSSFGRLLAVVGNAPQLESGCPPPGSATGDIHMQTFDGVRYDLQAAGEFVALQDPTGAMKMQMRLEADQSKRVSVATAASAQVDGAKIAIHIRPQPQLYVDGRAATLDAGMRMPLGKAGSLVSKENVWVITWPDETTASVAKSGDHLDVLVQPGRSAGTLVGLFGNGDGKPEGDLVTRNGVVLPGTGGFAPADLYGRFAESWRIRQDESLFHYGPGESTATFTDRTVPRENVTVAGLDAAVRARAESECRAAGITAPAALDDCILDVGVTGNRSFLQSASLKQAVAREPSSSASAQNQTQASGLPQGQSGIQLALSGQPSNLLWQWRVVKPDQPNTPIQSQDANHLAMSLPSGEYQVQTSALGSENQWIAWPQKIQVQSGQQAQMRIDSALRLDVPPDLAKVIWRWRVVSPPGREIQSQDADHRTVVLPPGEYQIETSAFGSENQWVVWPQKIQVEPGKQAPIQIDSSLRLDVPPDLAKAIWRWRVVSPPGREIQNEDADHRTLVLPAGEYQIETSAFGSENQWVAWPQKLQVRSPGQAVSKLDSGIRLAGAGAGDSSQFRLLDRNGATIQSWSGRTLEPFPPGTYVVQARPNPDAQWKQIASDLEVRPGSLAQVNVPALR